MKRAIREHLRDFLAIAVLLVIGLLTTGIILAKQGFTLPAWVPVGGSDRFELKAELATAQAVTPGQGQSVNIAGLEVGDITEVELNSGNALVTMEIDNKYAPLIHNDATALLRPRTGLQDMTVELDPGRQDGNVAEGSTIPVSRTKPNVQPDQILATLDGDTRAYLQLLLKGAGRGLGDRGEELSAVFRRFEPLARDLKLIGAALAERRRNIANSITEFKQVSQALGASDTRLAEFVDASAAALGSFADQEASIREALQELPSTLRETQSALASGEEFATVVGPASRDLIPSAQALGPALRALRPLLDETTAPLRDQIRPFSSAAQTPVRHLAQAADPLDKTTKGLSTTFGELNMLANAAAYNPPSPVEEGYLFWLAWLNHDTNALFFSQDAMGPMLRTIVIFGCTTAGLAEGVATPRPFLRTLQQMTNVPSSDDPRVCPPF
jgi:phospholipid/cholesterol/gamma-HCH transport system substrate-binding protein